MVQQGTHFRKSRPFEAVYGGMLGYVAAKAYAGSKLEEDINGADSDRILGKDPLTHYLVSAGFNYDTRDHELFPRNGSFLTVTLRAASARPPVADS